MTASARAFQRCVARAYIVTTCVVMAYVVMARYSYGSQAAHHSSLTAAIITTLVGSLFLSCQLGRQGYFWGYFWQLSEHADGERRGGYGRIRGGSVGKKGLDETHRLTLRRRHAPGIPRKPSLFFSLGVFFFSLDFYSCPSRRAGSSGKGSLSVIQRGVVSTAAA